MREAQFSIDESALSVFGIEELLALTEQAGLRAVDELACGGNSAVITVEVEERIDHAALETVAYVDRWELVSDTGTPHVYVIAFTAPGLPDQVAEAAEDLVGTCDPTLSREGITVSLTGPQGTIADTVGAYEDQGARPALEKLGTYEPADDPVDALTDRQEDVIRTAFAMGYYEVPREASTADVATDLGLDPSTVTEHLQRAERNLLAALLSTE